MKKVNLPETDKIISVMESDWNRLKEIEKMYFKMLKESEDNGKQTL